MSSSGSKTIADYPDAVDRIMNAHVGDDDTTAAEVRAALRGAGGPQVTPQVADGIVGSVLTEDRVIEAIDASGELPSEDEIDAIASVVDDYDMGDRVDAVSAEVEGRVVTREDVESAVERTVQETRGENRPTFREDVEAAVSEVSSEKELRGATASEVAGQQAREVGAPSRQAFDRARTQTIAQGDQVNPSELGVSDRTTPVSVITNDRGDAVGVVGGSRAEDRQGVAEEVGTDRVFDSPAELEDAFGLEQSERGATLTIDGEAVGEVEIE